MAFNWQTFKTRSLTAIVFVVVMMAGLLVNRWSFFLLFSVVHFGAWLEYQKLIRSINKDYEATTPVYKYSVMLLGFCFMLYFTNDELAVGRLYLSKAGFWAGCIVAVILPFLILVQSRSLFIKNIGYSIAGLLYISLPLGLLIDLRNHWVEGDYQLNLIVPLLIIFTLWVNDTMAYVVGSLIGKTPFSPISPKKTWEGTIGGVLLAVVVMAVIAYTTGKLSVVHTAVIAALASISGTYGDLFESKLKRLAGVKDSGHIMPGHGGFLDRFDSLLFAVSVVWFYVMIAM